MVVLKSKKLFLQVVLISLLTISLMINHDTLCSGNAVEVGFDASGGLLPINDTYLQMVEANVRFDIDETYGEKGEFRILFDGNYTIYNPNITIETFIGAPFFSFSDDIADSLKIEVENTLLNYTIVNIFDESLNFTQWEDYFGSSIYYERFFAICNITFTGYSNTTIRYSFDTITLKMDRNKNIYAFVYDVGTAAAWNGNITETVVFSIYGKQPHDFSCYSFNETHWINKEPIIEQIQNGFEYSWIWENERIKEKCIEISYISSDLWLVSNEGLMIGLSSLVLISTLYKRKRVIQHKI